MTPVVKRVLIALIVFGALVRLGMLIHFPNLDSAEAESYSKLGKEQAMGQSNVGNPGYLYN